MNRNKPQSFKSQISKASQEQLLSSLKLNAKSRKLKGREKFIANLHALAEEHTIPRLIGENATKQILEAKIRVNGIDTAESQRFFIEEIDTAMTLAAKSTINFFEQKINQAQLMETIPQLIEGLREEIEKRGIQIQDWERFRQVSSEAIWTAAKQYVELKKNN